MSKILGSIQNLEEAKILIESKIDIIDLKDPAKGALGKLEEAKIIEILNFINNKKLTSSTVGDLPNNKDIILRVIKQIEKTNVDFIKIGVYDKNYVKTLCSIKSNKNLIAVFFADKFIPNNKTIELLKNSGYSGVMLDTSDKNSGNIFCHASYNQIQIFLINAKKYDLITGIAGSVNKEHIGELIQLSPNYIGFRGAFCENKKSRASSISLKNVENIVDLIKKPQAVYASA